MNEWQRVVESDKGAVLWEYHDEDNDVHGYVIRGPGALCGYVGTRKAHGVWAYDRDKATSAYLYDYAFDWLPVHGGLSYDGDLKGTKAYRPGYYYIGWDYAHGGDMVSYSDRKGTLVTHSYSGHKWTVPEVAAHVHRVAKIFTRYKTLIENVEAGLCDRSAVELFKRLEDLD